MPRQNRRKTIGSREQFDRVLIVTEGCKTEPLYLNCFNDPRIRHKVLNIHCSSDSSPERLLQHAIERSGKNTRQKRSVESSYFLLPFDSVWIVFDRNGNALETIDGVMREAESKNIKIAFSQPCFEFWLLLHFTYSTREFGNCNEAKETLREYDSYYSKNGNFDEYMPRIDTAIKNSKKSHQFAKTHGLGSKSYTTVYKLIEELLFGVQKIKA